VSETDGQDAGVSDGEQPQTPATETLSSESVETGPAETGATEADVTAGADLPSSTEPAESSDSAEPTQESLTLPDERHSRTTELAARLRQSALAQVEAARAVQAAGGAISAPSVSSAPKIPALDDPSRRFDVLAATPPVVGADESTESDAPDGAAAPVDAEPTAAEGAVSPVSVEPDEVDEEPPSDADIPVESSAEAAEASLDDHVLDDAADSELPDAPSSESQPGYLSGPRDMSGEPVAGGRGLIAAAGLVCVLAVVAVVLWILDRGDVSHDAAIEKARVAAVAAAKTETAAALTYNYQTLDSDFAKAEAGMSKSFRANYAQTAAGSVTPLANKTHAVTTGTVAAAGVISASADAVQVLIFADQTVENKLLNATSRLDRSVIEVSMIRQDGRWVINDLKPF
jgi:Mce-associated membrane protein